jgi:hypothetical protein
MNHSRNLFSKREGMLFKLRKGMLLLHHHDSEGGAATMVKKAVIEVLLVEESTERTNEDIKREICDELSENLHAIPWAVKIEKLAVTGK